MFESVNARLVSILLFVMLMTGSFSASLAADRNPAIFIDCELSDDRPYSGEPVTATIYLYSETPDIAFIRRQGEPTLAKGEFETIKSVRLSQEMTRKDIDGRKFFVVPMEAFVFSVGGKGGFQFCPPSYEIGVSERVIVNDPFWGRVQSMQTVPRILAAKDVKFKAAGLPDSRAGSGFSGSIGKFNVSARIPKGDIFVGEESLAIVTVSGPGIISDSALPEYRSAFGDNVRLKSVSENRAQELVDGRLFSELTLELTFIPDSRDNVEIGPISFVFFNPETGEYETSSSDSVKVEVKSSTAKRTQIAI